MKENRFMNMPTRMWLLGILIAGLMTYAIRNSFVERGSAVLGFLFICGICEVIIWVLYDAMLPDFNPDESVWICNECCESGVIVVKAGESADEIVLNALNDHRWHKFNSVEQCSAEEDDIDVYENTLHITSFPAWTHFTLRDELLKYRQPLIRSAK